MISYVYKKPLIRAMVAIYDGVGRLVASKKPPRGTTRPTSICFIALHQIGDVVMCLPTLAGIMDAFPGAKFEVIAGRGPLSLFGGTKNAVLHPFDAEWQKVVRQQSNILETKSKNRRTTSSKVGFRKLLNTINPDAAVVFHPDLIVNQILGSTTIPHTFGFSNAGGGFHLSHSVVLPHAGHQVERNFTLAEAMAKVFSLTLSPTRRPHLIVDPAQSRRTVALLKKQRIDPARLVVIHPFASAQTKNWPLERWHEVMNWLILKRFRLVIIGGAADSMPTPTGAVSLVGKLSLSQTAALLKQARLFIGVDSGPGHIAAAVGCPLISIYSSVNDPLRWAPDGDPKKTIVLHRVVADRQAWPLEMRDLPPETRGNPYLDGITVKDVTAAAQKLISAKN